MRLYTAGIADFERIRQDGRIYIDKTDLIYKLTRESQFVFLSRPRRFGKSLLCSTLNYYFQGRKQPIGLPRKEIQEAEIGRLARHKVQGTHPRPA